jgi:hypothetical protein
MDSWAGVHLLLVAAGSSICLGHIQHLCGALHSSAENDSRAQVNRMLAPYGRKLGPDPSSIESCWIGGVVANNSSGMCCGVAQNTYHTVQVMIVFLTIYVEQMMISCLDAIRVMILFLNYHTSMS